MLKNRDDAWDPGSQPIELATAEGPPDSNALDAKVLEEGAPRGGSCGLTCSLTAIRIQSGCKGGAIASQKEI